MNDLKIKKIQVSEDERKLIKKSKSLRKLIYKYGVEIGIEEEYVKLQSIKIEEIEKVEQEFFKEDSRLGIIKNKVDDKEDDEVKSIIFKDSEDNR